jgi:hypothetical protein
VNAPFTPARSIMDLARDIGAGLERMIQIQMTAYPAAWTDEERREEAVRFLGLEETKP